MGDSQPCAVLMISSSVGSQDSPSPGGPACRAWPLPMWSEGRRRGPEFQKIKWTNHTEINRHLVSFWGLAACGVKKQSQGGYCERMHVAAGSLVAVLCKEPGVKG